jgi:hypothetical protein
MKVGHEWAMISDDGCQGGAASPNPSLGDQKIRQICDPENNGI